MQKKPVKKFRVKKCFFRKISLKIIPYVKLKRNVGSSYN